jgi:DNA-binding XRE family transcriptional regulator
MFEFAGCIYTMQQKEFQLKLGKQIAKLRKQKKISQVNFAYMLDMEKQNFNRIENGRTNPTSWTLQQIAVLLEVPIQRLFDWE